MTKLSADSPVDNVVLEWYLAIELKRRGTIKHIFPIFVGPSQEEWPTTAHSGVADHVYRNYFQSGSHPRSFPDVYVKSIYNEVEANLAKYGFKSPARMTVSEIVKKICEFQGAFVEGRFNDAAETICKTIARLVDK